MKVLKYILGTLGLLALTGLGVVFYLQSTSDGPIEPMQGGAFQTGEIIATPVEDWSFAAANPVAFELEGFGTSRMAGYIMHEGKAYMTCDLGYIWNRLEPGPQKLLLWTMYTFKHWHTDAVEDGRIRLRIDGKIYKANLEKVEDPALNQQLRIVLENQAKAFFAPMALPPEPLDAPNDVWFFKMDSRA